MCRIPNINAVVVSGGLVKNEMFVQIQADVLESEVIAVECGAIDMMLAGKRILSGF